MIKYLFLISAAVALSGGTRPPTEVDLGSNVTRPKRAEIPNGYYTKEQRGRLVMREFARCTFATSPAKVAAVAMLPPGADVAGLRELAQRDCLSEGIVGFDFALYRGTLFGEMYRRHEAIGGKSWTYPVSPINLNAAPNEGDSAQIKLNYFLLSLTDCVIAKNAEAVRAVVLQPVGSKAQEAAFSAIIPQLGPCLPQGKTITFNRTSLEMGFGEYMYRALAPVIPIAVGKPK